MLSNFNAQGLNLADKFGLNGSPLVLAADEWYLADWWTWYDCVQRNAGECQYSNDVEGCLENVGLNTCNGYDTWNNDFYTCIASEGTDCAGMQEWAIEYTDEAYWAGAEDYDYSLWLAELSPTPAGPVVFSFNFDPEEVNNWLNSQDGVYTAFDGRYHDEWMAYVDRVAPIYD